MTKSHALLAALALPFLVGGCFSHSVRVEPITLAPIQMTIDLNVHGDEVEVETSGSDDAAREAEVAE